MPRDLFVNLLFGALRRFRLPLARFALALPAHVLDLAQAEFTLDLSGNALRLEMALATFTALPVRGSIRLQTAWVCQRPSLWCWTTTRWRSASPKLYPPPAGKDIAPLLSEAISHAEAIHARLR
jgi:hypothetical protein